MHNIAASSVTATRIPEWRYIPDCLCCTIVFFSQHSKNIELLQLVPQHIKTDATSDFFDASWDLSVAPGSVSVSLF